MNKADIQEAATQPVWEKVCDMIDNTKLSIEDILKSDEVKSAIENSASYASRELAHEQTVLVVIAMDGAESYTVLVRCGDVEQKNALLANMNNRKKVIEARAAQRN